MLVSFLRPEKGAVLKSIFFPQRFSWLYVVSVEKWSFFRLWASRLDLEMSFLPNISSTHHGLSHLLGELFVFLGTSWRNELA